MNVQPEIVVALLGCAIASITDLRVGKIFNWLTLSMLVAGLCIHGFSGAPMLAVWGILFAFVLHFGLFALGVQRGGDAKLMIAVGALLGAHTMFEATLWCAVLYLPIGLAVLAIQGRFGNLVKLFHHNLARAQGADVGEAPPPTMLRTGPIIAAATSVAIFTDWLNFTSSLR